MKKKKKKKTGSLGKLRSRYSTD